MKKLLILVLFLFPGVALSQNYVTCENVPYYTIDGDTCSDELDPCLCSQTFSWDEVEGAEYYEVIRYKRVDFGGTDIKWSNEGVVGRTSRAQWSFPMDTPVGIPGWSYLYRVRACYGDGLCGPASRADRGIKQTALTVTCFPVKYGNPACLEPEDIQ